MIDRSCGPRMKNLIFLQKTQFCRACRARTINFEKSWLSKLPNSWLHLRPPVKKLWMVLDRNFVSNLFGSHGGGDFVVSIRRLWVCRIDHDEWSCRELQILIACCVSFVSTSFDFLSRSSYTLSNRSSRSFKQSVRIRWSSMNDDYNVSLI